MTKQRLIEDNMNLVYSFVYKQYPTYIHDEDIIQCGMLGLCKAAEKWDESKSQFSTFAWGCIKNEILMEFRKRAKHQGVLSLDYEVDTKDGKARFAEIIPGDKDVDYADMGIDVDKLKPREKLVYELCKTGMRNVDIAKEIGISRQAVWTIIRKLRASRG